MVSASDNNIFAQGARLHPGIAQKGIAETKPEALEPQKLDAARRYP